MKVSIIIPAYNERENIEEIVKRVCAVGINKEIIIVDDGSRDGSQEIIKGLEAKFPEVRAIFHETNKGKGAAIHTALKHITGDLVLIQDADLEYNPADYPQLLAPFEDERVQVVYGSRNLRRNPRVSQLFYWGGVFLSIYTNLLFGSRLTDITTGYKVFRAEVIKAIELRGNGFEFCAEVTARLLRRRIPIIEVPISYKPRSWEEGKKINSMDGVIAMWYLTKIRLNGK
ncbi:MAG TPA: glycosyltransferase family 2 protein [Anaerolineales bacterium]|nr:glycosyltransferase family 2 protein [Anaerolineales bacterium]